MPVKSIIRERRNGMNHKTTESTSTKHMYDLRLYTTAEAAAILNVSLRSVQAWIRDGTLPHTRLGEGGRLVRIRASDLQDFIAAGYQSGSGQA